MWVTINILTFFYVDSRGCIDMGRYDVIEKEISKGVKADEKSNVVIQGLSLIHI